MASTSAGAPALNYGDVNTVTSSPGEVKGLISSPEKISKEKKEIIESYNAIMKNKYQNQNYFMNYKGDIKINSSLGNLNGNNTFNIGRKNKNFFKDKSFNENEINIMNNNKNDNSSIKINSKIFDKSTEKDIIKDDFKSELS